MDFESERTRKLGCWNAPDLLTGSINEWTTNTTTADFALQEDYCNLLVDLGFGKDCSSEARKFWVEAIKSNYQGDKGRKRLRMATINLRDRDGLHGRVADVRCPVIWLHGTADPVYSVPNAKEEIKLFTNSPDARLQVVEGGQHFLSFSHPEEVDAALVEFVGKYGK
jgi:pimeloyl-ACP methyl ester carboxylesterase